MEVQLINKDLLSAVHDTAKESERLRMNFDLRTTEEDGSCLEGCLDWVFYEELPNMDAGGPVHDGEVAADEKGFAEVARFRICPREQKFGIQIPLGVWHSIEVHEPSTIFEAKDGAYIRR